MKIGQGQIDQISGEIQIFGSGSSMNLSTLPTLRDMAFKTLDMITQTSVDELMKFLREWPQAL